MKTYDEVIAYLQSYKKIKEELLNYETLREGVKAISYSQEEKGTVMATKDMMLEYTSKIIELQNKQAEFLKFIDKNFEGNVSTILIKKYFLLESYPEVAKEVGFSVPHTKRLVKRAIHNYLSKNVWNFWKLIPNDTEWYEIFFLRCVMISLSEKT